MQVARAAAAQAFKPRAINTSARAPNLVKDHKATHGVNDRLEDLDALGVKLVLVGAIGLDLRDGVGERARGVERVEVALAFLAQPGLLRRRCRGVGVVSGMRDGETERRRDGETERQRDGETESGGRCSSCREME